MYYSFQGLPMMDCFLLADSMSFNWRNTFSLTRKLYAK